MNDEATKAIRMVEDEAALADTHDIGQEGASRLRAATLILRRLLWGAFLVSLAACAPPAQTPNPPVTAVPNVSEPVPIAVPAPVVPEPSTESVPTGRARAGMAAVAAPTPFPCQVYANSLLPWKGDPKDPIFKAVGDATLPDAPEFLERRSHACAVLGMYKNSGR